MAVHDKILALLALQLGSLGRDVSSNNRRIIPVGSLQRGGEHGLTDGVEPVGVRAALRWAHCGEDLVGPSSHQHRVAVRKYAKRVACAAWSKYCIAQRCGSPSTLSTDTRVHSIIFLTGISLFNFGTQFCSLLGMSNRMLRNRQLSKNAFRGG